MNTAHNPPTIASPVNNAYTHAIETVSDQRLLWISGQIGLAPNDMMGTSTEEQAHQIFVNIEAILRSATMTIENIVKLTTYLVPDADLKAYGKVRSEYLGTHKPAMTSVIVPALVSNEWLLEIEVIAAA